LNEKIITPIFLLIISSVFAEEGGPF